MASGLTTVLPWPKVAAASSVGLPPVGDLAGERVHAEVPRAAPGPARGRRPASPSAPSFGASAANAVLQDLAKSVRNGTVPSAKLSEFLNDRPSTVKVFGQSTDRVRGDRAPVQQAAARRPS